jgi:hypothetical protein
VAKGGSGVGGCKGGSKGKGGEMTQTLYAHMNNKKKNTLINCLMAALQDKLEHEVYSYACLILTW